MAAARGYTLLVAAALSSQSAAAAPASFDQPQPRLQVQSLTFEGVNAVDESQLRRALHTRSPSRLPWRPRPLFDPHEFARDLDRLARFYDEQGYPEARVISHHVDVDDPRGTVRLHIVVSEGAPLMVAAVELENFDVLPRAARERLRAALPLQPGSPLAYQQALASRHLAMTALKNHGHAFPEVTLDRRPHPNGAVVVLRASPGERVLFGSIDIVGNVTVDDTVIRRQLAYRPGELFREHAIHETLSRLRRLELFTSANIEIMDPAGPAGDVATRVTVKEGDHHRYELSLGYGTEEQVSAEAEWRHVNFLGGARTLRLHGKWSWLDRGIDGTFVQPYFRMAPNVSILVQGQAWQVDERLFDTFASGSRVTATYTLGPHASVSAFTLNQYHRSRLNSAVLRETGQHELLAIGIDPATGAQSGLLSALGAAARLQRIDDPVTPARGITASAVVEQAGSWLPGTYDYVSVIGDLRGYSPTGGVVLAGRVRYGTIHLLAADSRVPFSKRFFLGGADSLRGWGRAEVAPLSVTGIPLGGNAYFEASAEVRTGTWHRLGAVAFLDAGNVWAPPLTLRPADLLYSAGAGLRYLSPIGPLRLDAGYQLTPIDGLRIDGEPQDRRWRIHFSVGHAF